MLVGPLCVLKTSIAQNVRLRSPCGVRNHLMRNLSRHRNENWFVLAAVFTLLRSQTRHRRRGPECAHGTQTQSSVLAGQSVADRTQQLSG